MIKYTIYKIGLSRQVMIKFKRYKIINSKVLYTMIRFVLSYNTNR